MGKIVEILGQILDNPDFITPTTAYAIHSHQLSDTIISSDEGSALKKLISQAASAVEVFWR